ncbi:MAG TPA: AAA family ATPase, partial [Myxococcota bacterium]|nr:AAA family ATPase [Myxococcota bacterium]
MKAAIAEASSFVGREQELVALDRLRGEGARLVTIVGASGAGKSRLASRWAARHAAADDGVPSVWVVDLAAAAAVDEVLDAIAAALEVELAPAARVDRALALLGSALAARGPALLVLDDFDRAVARAAGVVAALVARAPDATFLVTSREALGVEGEHRLEVSPLGLEEAAALFEARARAVGSGRALPAADRAAVLELVRRLDGLPLAVELAAGWAGALPPAVLTARLEQRLDLLRRAPRGEAPRHASLRGALDASWELLPEAERLVLARCAAFQGAFTLEAAEAVAAGGAIGPAAVAGLLRALRDRSLVAAAPAEPLDGELPRFALLESVRAYGAEKAVAAGEGEAAERRHAAYVVEAAEGLAAGARGRDGPRCRRKLAGLVDDLAAAYRVAATRDPGLAARAVLGAAPHFLNRGPLEAYAAALD